MNRLLAFGGILAVVGGFFMLVMPVSHIPLLDANRQVLVETERGGFCAGETYYRTRGMGDEKLMAECIETSAIDNEINHRKVQPGFCSGIISAGLPMTPEQCMQIMEVEKFWPTEKGSLSNSWNRRFPYPGELLSSNVPKTGTNDDSRTGDRTETDREEGLR